MDFPGEKGTRVDLRESYFAVELVEFPNKPADLDRVIAAVRSWLPEVGLPTVTVESRWTVRGANGGDAATTKRTVLTWKFEDGPPDAREEGSPEDMGPAWLDTEGSDGPISERVADGAWITRAEARRLAEERGYELSEDG
jgi:hypothetical protein